MKKAILLMVLVLVGLQLARITQDAGIFRSVEPEIAYGECEAIKGPIGAEDITIDHVAKIAYISADNRREFFNNPQLASYPSGSIWKLDLSNPNSQPEQIAIDIIGDFHPHGIALRFSDPESADQGKAIELYVVNHIDHDRSEVVVFTILDGGELKLRRRISYPEMISPNDLVVVAKDQFYVTNDHGSAFHSTTAMIEDYLGLPLASVTYFDGARGHTVIKNIRYANGIAISDDQETLYVAETTAGRVARYKHMRDRIVWKLEERLYVDMGVDNFEWDGATHLLNTGHTKLFDFQAHMKSDLNDSPSEVVRIDVSSEPMTYETIYLNKGAELSGASVAAKSGDTLLIGSVFEEHFLRCRASKAE